MPPAATASSILCGRLAQVLHRGEVRPLYQPIVDLDGGTPVADEALARSAALVGALGFGLGEEPAAGVRAAPRAARALMARVVPAT